MTLVVTSMLFACAGSPSTPEESIRCQLGLCCPIGDFDFALAPLFGDCREDILDAISGTMITISSTSEVCESVDQQDTFDLGHCTLELFTSGDLIPTYPYFEGATHLFIADCSEEAAFYECTHAIALLAMSAAE